MTTPADGWGGSTPPRPAAPDGKPGQWFVFVPWVYDAGAAAGLLRAAPRPALLIPVHPWARAYGLIRDPGQPAADHLPDRPRPRVRPRLRDDH
jgi:hypothetical protein